MCLFFDDDYEEVMRKLVGSLQDMRSWSDAWQVPSVSAISQARSRLGPEPMKELFERVAVPLAGPGTKGGWLGAYRLMAVDGFVLDVADTPSNVDKFGLLQTDAPRSSYPQVRVIGLAECGSHAIIDAVLGGRRMAEQALLPRLFRSFEPGMVVLADRGFYSYELWKQASETGAALLWRVSSNLQLPIVAELPDGSHLSVVFRRPRPHLLPPFPPRHPPPGHRAGGFFPLSNVQRHSRAPSKRCCGVSTRSGGTEPSHEH